MNKTILILADAFCGSYIDDYDMNYLSKFRKDNIYVPIIHPSFGFCERTEIFTGMRPSTSGNFTAIGYKPDESVYAKKKALLKTIGVLEKVSYKNARRLLKWYARRNEMMSPYKIPIESLALFRLTEDQFKHEIQGAFLGESIFDILSAESVVFSLDGFTQLGRRSLFTTDDERIQFAIRRMECEDGFIPIYISIADTLGHIYRHSFSEMKKMSEKLDKYVEMIVSNAIKHGYENIMFLGDHGMEQVTETIDIIGLLKNNKIRIHKDCEVFLDSTIARFWCNSSNIRNRLREIFNNNLNNIGFVVDESDFGLYGIPSEPPFEKLYGDLIWCANTGVLIYPDFFNNDIEKGMHGYANPSKYGMGTCICTGGKKIVSEAKLYDVCPTLCDMMGIRYPDKNEGRSFTDGK